MRGKWLVVVACAVLLNVCARSGWTAILIPDPAQVTETGSWTQGFHLFTNDESPLPMSYFNAIEVSKASGTLLFEKPVFHFYGTDSTYAAEDTTSWQVDGSTPPSYSLAADGTGYSWVHASTPSQVTDLYFSIQFLPAINTNLQFNLNVANPDEVESFALTWNGTARTWTINDANHGLAVVPEPASYITWLIPVLGCACMAFTVRRRKAAAVVQDASGLPPRPRWSDENRRAIYAIIRQGRRA